VRKYLFDLKSGEVGHVKFKMMLEFQTFPNVNQILRIRFTNKKFDLLICVVVAVLKYFFNNNITFPPIYIFLYNASKSFVKAI